MQHAKIAVVSFVLIVVCAGFHANVMAQKPVANRHLEILPAEQVDFYRFENMRVDKESGAPVALYRVNYAVKPSTPLDMATQYLQENSALLRIQPDIADLQHTSTRETPGGYHIRFLQTVNGYPVYKSDIVVNINRQNKVTIVMSNYKPLAKLDGATPSISLDDADRIAEDHLDIQGRIHFRDRKTVVYYNRHTTRLAHQVTIVPAEDKHGDWEVLIDARSGEIFRVEDKAIYVTGSGHVFDPDPLTRGRAVYEVGGQFGDNADADTDSLLAQIVQRDLLDIEFTGGLYYLRGPYAEIVDSESPFNGVFSQDSSEWHFTRNPSDFEAANVYFHLDQSMRYINETLGFSLMPFQYTGGVKGDPHGLSGADNSHYTPSTGEVAWGEGGVDDSEDEDVILHELGHGIHDWLTNGNLSQVEGLSEGCGDYWCASYNRSTGFWTPSDPQYYWTFQWDGHNEFWPGRVTDYPNHYPDGLVGQIHTDGQIWASTLMQIWDDIGRAATDLNFLEALANTGSSSGQEDAAQAFVQADLDLHGGANLSQIDYWFTLRGYTVTVPIPSITHIPLIDTEDVDGPYVVSATVAAAFPLTAVQLIHGTGGAFTDTLDMTDQGGGNYTGQITGTGSAEDYNYYIFAADSASLASTHPAAAPGTYHSFHAGPDLTLPQIVHSPLGNQAYVRWPATVQATITDNFGIDTAWVEYSVNLGSLTGSFGMMNTGGDDYSGTFDVDTNVVAIGDTVDYRIVAEDASLQNNQALDPVAGDHGFRIIDILGLVLIIDDDPSSSHATVHTDKGAYTRDLTADPYGLSAGRLESQLLDFGYLAVTETPATTDPGTWGGYDLLISSSGLNTSSLSNATYRNALVTYAQGGGKYIIEGGEVGWTWRNDTNFMTYVIHSSGWNGDNSGPLDLISSQAAHPMVTTPNTLPGSITITYTAYGSEDAMTPTDSYVIYETSLDPGDAGISVYDDDPDTTNAQMAYYALNFAQIADSAVARHLLENTVKYLLHPDITAPAMPDSFSVEHNTGSGNHLTWAASTAHDFEFFRIYRSGDWPPAPGKSPVQTMTGTEWYDPEYDDWTVYYALTTVDESGNESDPVIAAVPTAIRDPKMPSRLALYQNMPNPFNPTTVIRYDVPAEGARVSLAIYDVGGRLVRSLLDGNATPGKKSVEWNGKDSRGNTVSTGVYFYRLRAGDKVITKKMVMIK
jgi:Zn-dependent metalloprotease